MLHKNITLNTSNKNKINEFKRFGLNIQFGEGTDLKEIDSNIDDVILYKAIDAGDNILVEDTVLEVDGKEIIDIRWKISELAKSSKDSVINFITSLAIIDNGFVYIYRGAIKCKIVPNIEKIIIPEDAFGFDPYLIPEGSEVDFYTLEKQGQKDLFSPRKTAVNLLNNGQYLCKIKVDQVPTWTGAYQNS